MYTKEFCFILKRFLPNKNKLSVLSKNAGKIEIISSLTERGLNLWPGMMLSFFKTNGSRIYFVQNIEIIMFPYYDKILDIVWIHKLLEICYFFSPLEKPASHVFDHIYNCFKIHKLMNFFDNKELLIIKKIFIIKLLVLLGYYPTKDLIIFLKLYQEICSLYNNSIDNKKINLLKVALQEANKLKLDEMDLWINSVLLKHPNCRFFKTFSYTKSI